MHTHTAACYGRLMYPTRRERLHARLRVAVRRAARRMQSAALSGDREAMERHALSYARFSRIEAMARALLPEG